MADFAASKAISMFGIASCFLLIISGCARLKFNDSEQPDSLTYYEVEPYLFVQTNKDCVSSATTIALPGKKRSVEFRSGYGSADLSVSLSAGIVTSVGQKTDTKIPETLTAIGGLATAGILATGKQFVCEPTAALYSIRNGIPDISHPIVFPVTSKIVDFGQQ